MTAFKFAHHIGAAIALSFISLSALASVGLSSIPATAREGSITLYCPSSTPAQSVKRGSFTLLVAEQGAPTPGNGRLVVISHGSGGSPWMHADLATRLVDAGFVVAMQQHRGDHHLDNGHLGPESWARRPAEVSRAIDAVGRDARFASTLKLDKVGMYGMSAGGLTAWVLAVGRWSPAGFKQHCEAHLAEDFQTCAGLFTRLTGGMCDGLKKTVALAVLRHQFDDATPQMHTDPRIAAVVSGVHVAAVFDMASLAHPCVPVALITAARDRWLIPKFHSDRGLPACLTCQHLADLKTAGPGALLAPLPPGFTGLIGELLNDPPGFDRA